MLTRLLLHLDGGPSTAAAISSGVQLAARHGVQLRGLLLVDTRRLTALAISAESASSCTAELERLALVDWAQDAVRQELSQACATAGVMLDVRQLRGDPLALLPAQAAFHDLVVMPLAAPAELGPEPGRLSVADVLSLVPTGVHPLLVLRPGVPGREPARDVRRVLLINDGTPSSAAAIRQYLAQQPFPDSEHRLLAVAETTAAARVQLAAIANYARQRQLDFESGCLRGTLRQLLRPYVEKWEADLVVLGAVAQHALLRPLWQSPLEQLLQTTNVGLFTSS